MSITALLLLAPAQLIGGEVRRYATLEDSMGWPPVSQFILAGDLNADGFEDLVIAEKEYRNGWRPYAGAVTAISGADRSVLFRMVGQERRLYLGISLDDLGDVNGDGFDDVIVGGRVTNTFLPAHGVVRVLSGKGDAILYEIENQARLGRLGTCVRGVGDLNQDGFPDFAYLADTSVFTANYGIIVAASGATGRPLYSIDGAADFDIWEFQGVGDLDGDAVPDLVVSFEPELHQAQGVAAFSGSTGAPLWKTIPPRREIAFGYPVAGAGDIDGDGHGDVLVGAPRWTTDVSNEHRGACYLLSGADGRIARITTGVSDNQYSWFAYALAGGTDFNEDGVPDYLIGASGDQVHGSPIGSGAVHLYSGASGMRLASLAGAAPSSGIGAWIELPHPPSRGEGTAVFVLGWVQIAPSRWHSAIDAWIFRPYLRLNAHEVSATQGGTVRAELDFPDDLGGMNYAILLSASGTGPAHLLGLTLPLTRDVLLEATIRGQYPNGTQGGRGSLDAEGRANAEFRLVPGVVPPGRTIHIAAVAWDPVTRIPLASSIAAELRIGS